ncbi:MAG: hypothetical protein HPY74_02525 [Firmicutes bacterium]|nr:hypothetical protein [Bacillota bacterium]
MVGHKELYKLHADFCKFMANPKRIEKLKKVNDLCIVGCGFIGVEIAEECRRRRPDLNISIVEMLSHCLQLVYDGHRCSGKY